jgi:phenylacetate-coenzyme A ligase PaaK-like adenylate-forming protein
MLPLRELQLLGIPWKNTKIVHIGNFNPYRIDLVVRNHFHPYVRSIMSVENILNIDVNNSVSDIMEQLNEFKPDIIMTYPATFQFLASLKRNGEGPHVNPILCWSGGAILDDYTRAYVQDAFKCRLLNIYPSVEAAADIAFECKEGTWHVHDDYFHLEAIDDQNNLVAPGERGHIVISRLWGRGTPIIRYTGMDDWVRLSEPEQCNCGLTSSVLIGGVEGRMRANIILPNGKVFPPGAFCFITPVLNKLNTFKVKQYQIVQKTINEIVIYLVIDETLRHKPPPVKTIIKHIKQAYEQKVGSDVSITVIEVDEIKHPKDARKPPPIVISHVSQTHGMNKIQL